jgi:hypothetical protein
LLSLVYFDDVIDLIRDSKAVIIHEVRSKLSLFVEDEKHHIRNYDVKKATKGNPSGVEINLELKFVG